jgi:prephenate dehydrogenase
VGRGLEEFGAFPLEIDTEGYNRLLHILGVVKNDTWELFLDMHKYNPYAEEARSRLLKAMNRINALLAGRTET